MKFCQDHWDALRAKIEERGLAGLVAPSGVIAAEQQKDQFERALSGEQEATPANFDPLMSAHWAIASNAMSTISPLYLMADGDEDPVEGFGQKGEGRTWPRCPLCYLNLAHELTCKDARCTLDEKRGYDWMLDRAADEAKDKAVELGLVSG